MANEQQNIIIYTKRYPYGLGEPFLHEEVILLSKKYAVVYLCPLPGVNEKKRDLPANVKVLEWKPIKASLVKALLSCFFISLKEKKALMHLKHFRFVLSYYRNILRYEDSLRNFIANEKNLVHYSYWLEDWAVLLSKVKKQIPLTFVSRVHGFDIFSDRWAHKFIPFRSLQLRSVEQVIFVSENARQYMSDIYPGVKHKFSLSKLGAYDHGVGKIPGGEEFVLVSCSNIIPLKRVDKIAEALAQLDFKIKWIHIGGGKDRNLVEQKIKTLPGNIHIDFKGEMPHDQIMQFYKENAIDAMILLSQTEGGVPVSLQEAASFGIPLIGTNAGGIPEIVNSQTGILVSNDFTIEEIAQAIRQVYTQKLGRNPVFRAQVREFWEKNHDILHNFTVFYNLLQQTQV